MTNSESNKSHLKRSKTSLQRKKKSERIGSDTTEQRKPDDQDNKQEEMYKTLIENIPCAVYSAFPGERGPTTFMSQNWKDWTGYTAEEFYQDPEAWPKCIYPDDREKAVNAYIEACKNEASYNLEYRIVHRDTGQVRYVRDQGLLSKDAKGTLLRVDGNIMDITELKTSENELVKYRDHLEELVKERTAELEKANEVLKQQAQECKNAEEALRESEEKYRQLFETEMDAIMIFDAETREFLDVNDAAIHLYGYCREEFLKLTQTDITVEKEASDASIKQTSERHPIRIPLRYHKKKDGTIFPVEISGSSFLFNGRKVICGIVRDITERQKAEEKLRQYDHIVSSSTDMLALLNKRFVYMAANSSYLKAFRKTPDEVIGHTVSEVFGKEFFETVIKPNAERCLAGEEVNYQAWFDFPAHEPRYMDINYYPYIESNNKVSGFVVNGRDITDRKQTEEALAASELKYRSLFDNSIEGIGLSKGNRVISANKALLDIFGYDSIEEFTKIPILDHVAPESREMIRGLMGKAKKGDVLPATYEYRIICKNGLIKDIEISTVQVSIEGQKYTQSTFRDITDRNKEAIALRDSEEKYRTLFEAASDGILTLKIADEGAHFIDCNSFTLSMFRCSQEEFIGKSPADFSPTLQPDGISSVEKVTKIAKAAMAGESQYFEWTHRRLDETPFDAEVKLDRINIAGETYLQAIVRDITERKKAEMELKENEERFRSLSNAAFEGIVITKEGRFVDANAAFTNLFGYEPDEITGKEVMMLVAPEDRKLVMENIRSGYEKPYEHKALRKDGSILDVEVCGKTVLIKGQECRITAVRDITDRKKAVEELKKQKYYLEKAQDIGRIGTWELDIETNILVWTGENYRIFGVSTGAELTYETFLNCVHPDDREYVDKQWNAALNKEPYDIEHRILVDGEVKWVREKAEVEFDEKGICIRAIGFTQDITERKKAEERLLDYQAKLKSLASQLSLTEESERRRIATELHDQIGQSLVFSKIKLDELHQSATSSELTKALDEICNNIGRIIQDTRTLTFDLSSPILNELGLEAAVAEWLDVQIREKHGIETEFVDDGQQKLLDDDILALLFRNVRELLVNVIKHADAHKVKVSIRRVNEHIHINVEDDGKGFDAVKVMSTAIEETKFGLFSIRQRLEQLGGQFEIDTEERRGSKITMTAPLKLTISKK